MIRRAVFQAGAAIADNHPRNFEWMVNAEGQWRPAPLFDLEPNPSGAALATPVFGLRAPKQILVADLPALIARKTGLPLADVATACAQTAQRMADRLETVIVRAGMGVRDAEIMRRCVPVAHLATMGAQWAPSHAPVARPSAAPRP